MDFSKLDPNESNSAQVIIPISIFFAIAFISIILRIYSRIRPYFRLGWDDYFIIASIVLATVGYAIVVQVEHMSGGHHTVFIPLAQLNRIAGYSFVLNFIWIWCLTFLKISITLMLLRIMDTRRSRMLGYGFIGVLVVISVAATIAQLLQCRPISAAMVFVPVTIDAKCWTQQDFQLYAVVTSSVYIVTDFVCALLPIVFIRKLNRPKREKIVIAILMGLGVLAGVCGIIKAVMLQRVFRSLDPFYDSLPVIIATFAEMSLGITAANVPCLKALFEKLFKSMGTQLSNKYGSRHSTMIQPSQQLSSHKASDDDLELSSPRLGATQFHEKQYIQEY